MKNFITVKKSGIIAIYTIHFTADSSSDTWAFFSKHSDNITNVETTNISSYTLDNSVISTPYALEVSRTYLIKIVKTDTNAISTISFTITLTDFTKLNSAVDFSIGNGHFTYGLDAVNGLLYKVANTRLTLANTSGIGTWTVDPLDTTLTLPTLPAGSNWVKLNEVLNGKHIISGGNGSTSKNKYFCYLQTNGTITDLNGNLNTYSTFLSGRNYAGSVFASFYNYIDNTIHFLETSGGSNQFTIDLNTNTLSYYGTNNEMNHFSVANYRCKNFFNPYKKEFCGIGYVDLDKHRGSTLIMMNGMRYKNSFNRNTGYTVCSQNNDYKRTYVLDQYSVSIRGMTAVGTGSASVVYNICLDHDKNVYVGSTAYNYFVIVRIDDLNYKAFTIQHPEGLSTYLTNGMFAYGDLHLLMTSYVPSKRLYCIDTSDPNSGSAPDFNYYDFPSVVVDMHTNRLL